MRALFVIQGEGRGHMTQALALSELLEARGHAVCAALIGRGGGRKVPAFFTEGINAPVHFFVSPGFAYENGAVRLGQTVREGLRKSWVYAHHLQILDQQITAYQPDVIVNFYEGMVGLYQLAFRSAVPVVCIGHQYMFGHPAYRFASGQRVGRAALKAYTRLTALGAARRLALSFYPAKDLPDQNLRVIPPLLRRTVLDLNGSTDDGSLLIYLLNRDRAEGLEAWHRRRPDVPVRCFWDGEARHPYPNLRFHPLCGTHFLQRMAQARGVVCTAGFESVSEALWLGKPVYMIPTPGHLEQRTNALDAQRIGAGLWGTDFDLDGFLQYLDQHSEQARANTRETFQAWVKAGEARVVEEIESVSRRRTLIQPVWETVASSGHAQAAA